LRSARRRVLVISMAFGISTLMPLSSFHALRKVRSLGTSSSLMKRNGTPAGTLCSAHSSIDSSPVGVIMATPVSV